MYFSIENFFFGSHRSEVLTIYLIENGAKSRKTLAYNKHQSEIKTMA